MSSGIPGSITAEGICNLALGHLRVGNQVSILVSEQSAEANACRLFYDLCRQTINADFKWPFATTQVALALVESSPFIYDAADGDSEWAYAYQYPADCLNFVRILSGIRNETRQERVPFRIVTMPKHGKVILTDMACAFGEYTQEVLSEDSFSANYILAFSLKLAVLIAPLVTGGDPFKLGDRAQRLYEVEMTKALANAFNEEQVEENPESEFVEARGYRDSAWTRFGNGGSWE